MKGAWRDWGTVVSGQWSVVSDNRRGRRLWPQALSWTAGIGGHVETADPGRPSVPFRMFKNKWHIASSRRKASGAGRFLKRSKEDGSLLTLECQSTFNQGAKACQTQIVIAFPKQDTWP